MKKIFYLLLLAGIAWITVSEQMRQKVYRSLFLIKGGAERLIIRGNHMETRFINDDAEFERAINEPGRLVIVSFENKLLSVSETQSEKIRNKLRSLPAKVLLVRVQQERNEALIQRQKVQMLPTLRVYKEGKYLREFKAPVDEDAFFSYINDKLENWFEKS